MNKNISSLFQMLMSPLFVSFFLFWAAFPTAFGPYSHIAWSPQGRMLGNRILDFFPSRILSLRVCPWRECGQGLLKPKGGERPIFLRRECRMKASCLGTGTPDSVLAALCDFSVPWKYMAVSREATGGNRSYLKKRLVCVHGSHFISSAAHTWMYLWVSTMLFFITFYIF